ncbi:MAG: tRNA lysidine(34) synthetase TilS [Candidatus Cryptobacteroides sp.]
MQKRFDGILDEFLGLLGRGDRESCILLAVSGGVDSLTMAELFAHSGLKISFALAHCNFRLRGDESDGDAEFVTAWAERAGVTLHSRSFDTAEYARSRSVSTEMAARELRYRWFDSLCEEFGYDAIAVAHNANDNAETLFLNILRGSGINGLSGMKGLSPSPYGGKSPLMRPMLTFTRDQIEGYARSHGLLWREDRTNAETEYKRNRIRNLVFPVFETINPSFIRTVNRDMALYSSAAAIADDYFRSLGDFRDEAPQGEIRFDIGRILSTDHCGYVLYRLLEPFLFNPSVIASVESLLKSGRTVSGKTFLSPSHRLLTSSTHLIICERKDDLQKEVSELTVDGEGEYVFNGALLQVEIVRRTADFPLRQEGGRIAMDASAVPMPFVLRCRRDGDWFRPLGMKGRKKLSDWFTDRKYDIAAKDASIVLSALGGETGSSSHILAILGGTIDDSVRITDDTDRILLISKL